MVNQSNVRPNEDGFAGFFEDLPVLIIVLGGVFILVLTATRISADTLSSSADSRLKTIADSIVDRIRFQANALDEVAGAPMLSALARINLSQCAEQATLGRCEFRIVMVVLHPDAGRIISSAGNISLATGRLAVSSTLMNAIDDASRSVVVEVRAMVQ